MALDWTGSVAGVDFLQMDCCESPSVVQEVLVTALAVLMDAGACPCSSFLSKLLCSW